MSDSDEKWYAAHRDLAGKVIWDSPAVGTTDAVGLILDSNPVRYRERLAVRELNGQQRLAQGSRTVGGRYKFLLLGPV